MKLKCRVRIGSMHRLLIGFFLDVGFALKNECKLTVDCGGAGFKVTKGVFT